MSPRETGPLDRHAPQIINLVTGLVIGALGFAGITLTDANAGLLHLVVSLLVPAVLAWAAGKLAESKAFSYATVVELVRKAHLDGRNAERVHHGEPILAGQDDTVSPRRDGRGVNAGERAGPERVDRQGKD